MSRPDLQRDAERGSRLRVVVALAGAAVSVVGCGDAGSQPAAKVEDFQLLGFVDGDTDGDPTTVRLSDYFAENRPGTRIIMLNAAAGWCVPCMREAGAIPAFAALYEPRGVAILVAVFQDQNGAPAEPAFVKSWVDTFDLTVPALIDTAFQTSAYFAVNALPANLFVDAETQEILTLAQGAEPGNDPMQNYRALLDHYLQ